MTAHKVLCFEPYPFKAGQKLHIDGGPRKGDWEVVGCDEREVTLRCPVSGREFRWNGFYRFAGERQQAEWPGGD